MQCILGKIKRAAAGRSLAASASARECGVSWGGEGMMGPVEMEALLRLENPRSWRRGLKKRIGPFDGIVLMLWICSLKQKPLGLQFLFLVQS